jgi:uncharacterized protein YbcI
MATTEAPSHDNLSLAVSNGMVGLYKQFFGRGPTKAQTAWAGDDMLVCTLQESLTPAERALVELGEAARVRETRTLFQYARADDFRGLVEEATGRTVHSFLSGIDPETDVAFEAFLLEPNGG